MKIKSIKRIFKHLNLKCAGFVLASVFSLTGCLNSLATVQSGISDGSCKGYGSISINKNAGRSVDVSTLTTATVIVSGYDMTDLSVTGVSLSGGTGSASIENIPAGSNRVVTVKSNVDGALLRGLVDVVADTDNSVNVNWSTTAVASVYYYLIKNGVDVYKENWLIKGELTNVGKRQLYLLGVKTRKKYMEENDFLSKEYNPKEILIKSTDHNRTIESVYSYIQGLYPAGTGPTINEILYSKEKVIFPPNEKYYKQFKDFTNEYNMRENKYALPYQMTILPIHIFYKPDHDFQLYDPDICTTLLDHFIELNEREEIKTVADDILNETNNLLVDIEPNADNASYFYDY